jgi:chemotaxis protein methyltransferase WspC
MAEGRSLSLSAYRDTLEASRHELDALVQALVVPETYFFRHPESFIAMRDWMANFPRRPVRILCVACSTGEEPYSVAMSLLQAGFARENFSIEAWDLSSKAIAIAIKGVYSSNSFRGTELSWRADHFMPCEGGWRISEQVRHLIKFRCGNLFDLHAVAAFDIVFCRNVLIYFSTARQQQALHGISRALADDGILFLGPAEPPILPVAEWKMTPYSMSFSCVKRPHATLPRRSTASATRIRPAPARRATPRPIPSSDPARVNPGNLLDEANALADRGRLSEAKGVLQKALATEPQNPRAHCLMGIVEEASGEAGLAEASYRKAIYLDPSQIDALQHMVLLLERQGRSQAAEQWRRRARKHASP